MEEANMLKNGEVFPLTAIDVFLGRGNGPSYHSGNEDCRRIIDDEYFQRLVELVLRLHGIPMDHPGVIALRHTMADQRPAPR